MSQAASSKAVERDHTLAGRLGRRCTLYLLQVMDALNTLGDNCTPSASAADLIEEIQEDNYETRDNLARLEPFAQWQEGPFAALEDQRRAWERDNYAS